MERVRKREGERERRKRDRKRERRKIEGNRQRFILKSGLLLSGEGRELEEGGRMTEAAILPPPIQYGHGSANCLSLPLVPDGREEKKRRERER